MPQLPVRDPTLPSRFLKILYFVMFFTVGLYWFVLELLADQINPADVSGVKTALAAESAITVVFVLYLRFSRIPDLISDTAGDLTHRLSRLRFYHILCYTLSESVALFGFIVRFLGATREEAIPFFVGAVGLFLLCYPRLPTTPGHPTG